MILQHIVFPEDNKEKTKALYYRSNKKIEIQNRYEAVLPADCSLDLLSYFNGFSASRWSAYTSVSSIEATVTISGCGCVKLFHQTSEQICCLKEEAFHSEKEMDLSFCLEELPREGFYFFTIISAKDSSVSLKNGCFFTKKQAENPVELAIASCTYHREPYIIENSRRIRETIFEAKDSQLKEHLDFYIIDNGQTLHSEQFFQERFYLISNPNTGGSGGFTRGLIEILHQKEHKSYTHALLMDDDIKLDPESLERTYSFLCYLKKEYLNYAVGGAMLRNDQPCILEESGANWNGYPKKLGKGLDFQDPHALFQYDSLPNGEYQAWWYCCIPLSQIDLNHLPLPFFIHGDDVEYGLRSYQGTLALNGICVWHDTFENKRPSSLEYYDIRNNLIVNSVCKKKIPLSQQLLQQFKRSTASIWRMRYDDVLLQVRGIEDFLKGPDWWSRQDIVALHKEIIAAGYSYLPLPEIELKAVEEAPSKAKKLRAILTMNGAFFPKKQETIILNCGTNPFALYRRKDAYLLDPDSDKAIHVQFSFKKMLFSYQSIIKSCIRLCWHYSVVKRQYKEAMKQIGTERFWLRHFFV